MDIEHQRQVTSSRLSRLREARQALQLRRDAAAENLSAREARLGLLPEDTTTLAAAEETRIRAAAAALRKDADEAEARLLRGWHRLDFLFPGMRAERKAVSKVVALADDAQRNLPNALVQARRDAREQAGRNAVGNARKRRALGSLPGLVGMMDAALEAVSKGDPAVSTCLLRGQVDRALRVASIWKARQLGHMLTSADIGEYMSANAERDAPYEAHDRAMLRADQARAMSEMLGERLEEMRLRGILRTLQESGPPIRTVDVEWEEVKPQATLLLQDDGTRGSTP